MATDDNARKVPVQKGSAGTARRSDPRRRTASEEKPSKEELDARQERMRPTRRRGPVLEEGAESRSRAGRQPAEVPETECDEPGGGE
jgi:hypothetical protein